MQGPFQLHDVHDVEGLCQSILNRVLRSWGARLNREDSEDALAYLIATAWRLSLRYDCTRSQISFSTYASRILERRVVDWYRSSPRFADTRYRERPTELSLEALQDESELTALLEEPDDGHEANVLARLKYAATKADAGDAERWALHLRPTEAAA